MNGFGLPLVEAVAKGKSVFTSNCASMSEVVGDAGLFVDPIGINSMYNGFSVQDVRGCFTPGTGRERAINGSAL